MTHSDDRPDERAPGPKPERKRMSPALLFVIVLSAFVMAVAVLVAVWMYWLAGAVLG
jgi:hypothetical protein